MSILVLGSYIGGGGDADLLLLFLPRHKVADFKNSAFARHKKTCEEGLSIHYKPWNIVQSQTIKPNYLPTSLISLLRIVITRQVRQMAHTIPFVITDSKSVCG